MTPTITTPQHETRRARRGTVLLFVLGVLAVIAVAALSYVTFVRLDRQSAAAVASGVGYERQVNLVRDHIGDLIAADLFGDKQVTKDVPRSSGNIQLWPRMFEDAEYRDYPWTDFSTFDRNNKADRNYQPSNNAVLNLIRDAKGGMHFQVAPRDDAWLAASEPVWITNAGRVTRAYWPQITNLRSAYTYDDHGTATVNDDRWVRGDGLYVDLGQFFLDQLTSGGAPRANPGTNFLDTDLSTSLGNGNGALRPALAAGDYQRAPYEQMNMLNTLTNDGAASTLFDKSDERFWADTDGDLRPDARWQVLDELGNFNGLVWFVAARIIDASAMINYNAAIDGGYRSGTVAATGRTPADIDLERLLYTAAPGVDSFYPPTSASIFPSRSPYTRIQVNKFNDAFGDHLVKRMKAQDILDRLQKLLPAGTVSPLFGNPWKWDPSNSRLDQSQRDAMWNWVGSSPLRTRVGPDPNDRNSSPIDAGYRNLAQDFGDLLSFWGVNRRATLSDIEETFDSPDYLPDSNDPQNPNRYSGPLLSNTLAADTRFFGNSFTGGFNEGSPTATEMRWDTRRLLTPLNGSGEASPIPVLNMDDRDTSGNYRYANRYRNDKVSLVGFSREDVPAAYEALVGALAPFSTDQTLSSVLAGPNGLSPINGATIDNATTYHYGGGPDGPAVSLPGFQPQSGFEGASFADLTAAEMAVNLADASDTDATPTVARLLPTQQDNATGGGLYDCSATSDVIELGTAFSQGDIPPTLLSSTIVGDPVNNGADLERACENGDTSNWELSNKDKGVTIVGLERHPYIMEVFSAAAYTTSNNDTLNGLARNCAQWKNTVSDPYDPNYQVGALIAFQLGNPWDTKVSLGGCEVRMVKGTDIDPTGKNEDQMLSFVFQPNDEIPAHRTQTYVFFYDSMAGFPGVTHPVIGEVDDSAHPGGGPDAPRASINPDEGLAGDLISNSPAAVDALVETSASFDPASKPVFFQNLADTDMHVLLVQTGVLPPDPADPLKQPRAAVVDKLDNSDSGEKFPAVLESGAIDFRTAVGGEPYFVNTLGYPFGCPNVRDRFDQGFINGRVIVTGSLTRPTQKWKNSTGFPMYVMDFGSKGNALVTTKDRYVHAWLQLLPDGPDGTPYSGPPECDDDDPQVITDNNGVPMKDLILDATDTPKPIMEDTSNLLYETRKPYAEDGGAVAGTKEFPHQFDFNWQLFCPNTNLYSVADIGMLCTYANLVYDNKVTDLDSWRTVGEQLARSLYYDYSAQASDILNPGATPNPYIGTLDLSRFIPTGQAFGGSLYPTDESFAMPLALRVFDCFEGLKTWNDQSLVNGRMNINTMPDRCLETLPMLAPWLNYPNGNLSQTLDRVKLVEKYRSGRDPDNLSFIKPDDPNMTNMTSPPLRRSDLIDPPEQLPSDTNRVNPSGIATAGELAILDQWSAAVPGDVDDSGIPEDRGFVAGLGKDGANDRIAGYDGPDTSYDATFDPTDDSSERLALYRAVSNLVSSRSDVFVAWFIIRGYDPDAIESIKLQGATGDRTIRAMDSATDPEFAPAYESRWLVVYDRSNVKRPTDRPRIILQAELPSAKP